MEVDIQQKIAEAKEAGRFEGQVLQSLKEIKESQIEMNNKLAGQDGKLGMKADKSEAEEIKKEIKELKLEIKELQRWRWLLIGGFGAVQIIIALIK